MVTVKVYMSEKVNEDTNQDKLCNLLCLLNAFLFKAQKYEITK
jgi:hypothetical protein